MGRRVAIYLCVLVFSLAGFLLTVYAARNPSSTSSVSLIAYVYDQVVDEQDTTSFYHNGTNYCPGSNFPIQFSLLQGDHVTDPNFAAPTDAYTFGAPWTTASGLSSTAYADGDSCGNNCLRVQFASSNKTFAFDTRGTSGPRKLTVNFFQPCGTSQGCPGPAGDPSVFGGSVTTAGLLDIFLDFPYTSMAVCSSTACPEAQPAFAKFWFTDPSNSSVTWRIDWSYLRVLRMSSNTWYVVADECDGSQVAGLSQLVGNRTQPKTVFNGYYEIPFFIAIKLK